MAHANFSRSLLALSRAYKSIDARDPVIQCLAPRLSCTYATETPLSTLLPTENLKTTPAPTSQPSPESSTTDLPRRPSPPLQRVLTTLYDFPTLAPTSFAWYHPSYLSLPLRKDLLHRAIIYEADSKRRGTASTKWRDEVHGSHRKILPQKGSGKARAGDKQSPIRRGGGIAHGPKPKDWSSELPSKIYDIAWRTALSYRYAKGELIVLDNSIEIPKGVSGKGERFLTNVFTGHKWGKGHGRTLMVTTEEEGREGLYDTMDELGEHGEVKSIVSVDVKKLLEFGRVVIERDALNALFYAHSSDLGSTMDTAFALKTARKDPRGLVLYGNPVEPTREEMIGERHIPMSQYS